MTSAKLFTELPVWISARQVRKFVMQIVKQLPRSEKYKLADQITRSARSITANIAEGFGRFHYQENIQYCRQARGSLSETLEHLICAYDDKYISEAELLDGKDLIQKTWKEINGYIKYLQSQQNRKC